MKFNAKKLAAMGLASAMAVGTMAGCSSGSSSTASTTAAGTTQAAAAGTTAADTTAAGADSESKAETTAEEVQTEAPTEEEHTFEKPAETVTLTVFSQLANYSGEQVGWSAKLLLDKFNIKLNIVNDPDGSQLSTRMQSGDLGDIVVWGSDGDEYEAAMEAGYLLNWNKDDLLTNHGPYIKANMQKALQKNMDISGGTLYGFGHDVATSSADIQDMFYTWDLRWDLYDQLGRPEVKNLDDYLELMKQMKEICPTDENGKETYALSMWPDWDGNMVMYVKAFATAYYGYDEMGIGLYNPDNGEFYDCLAEDGPYMTSLRFINKLYQNGLVDPNSMTQTYDKMGEKVKAGGVFFQIFNYCGSASYNTDEHIAENKMMLPLVPEEATPLAYGMSQLGGNRVWTIGANTKYPELCMEFINWLCTPEGTLTYFYGPQGTCWDYDEEGYTYLTDFGLSAQGDRKIDMVGDYAGLGNFNDGCIQINNTTWSQSALNLESKQGESYQYKNWVKMQSEPRCDIEAAWREFAGANTDMNYIRQNCNFNISPASTYQDRKPTGELKVKWNTVTDSIKNGSWKAIYAKDDAEFEKIVSDLITEVKGYGYDECVEYCQENAQVRYALATAEN